MVRIKKKEICPHGLISLRSISGLSGIDTGRVARIGTMTSISDVLKNESIDKEYPVLVQAARNVGSVQIRNMATIGGNLCNGSPAADMALPLLVLEAKLRLQSIQGSRVLTLERFFRGPGETNLSRDEILAEILIDPPAPGTHTVFLKKGRTRMDLAVASVAVLIRTEGQRCSKARVAAGSVAPTPLRLFEVETLLERAAFSREQIVKAQRMAAECVSPITDIRATADYRRHLVAILVRRALEKVLNKDPVKRKDREFRNKN